MSVSERDAELRAMLRAADRLPPSSAPQLRALSARIRVGAGPALDARAAGERTIWDYAERWSAVLLPVGAFTALAAGVCLFVLAGPIGQTEPPASRASSTRVALLGAATNNVSSQTLIDLLVAADAGAPNVRRGAR
ncbi:MAG: hypothetical protein ABI205_03415 [Gemmatimonadaceae bacterium]